MKTLGLFFTTFLLFCVSGIQAQENKSPDGVYNKVEVMPEFKGGNDAMIDYLIKNIKYPEQAKKDSISGKVLVQFVVSETGKITDVKVVRSVSPLLNDEASRVIASMPDWIPGKEKGKPVKVSFVLPISFALK